MSGRVATSVRERFSQEFVSGEVEAAAFKTLLRVAEGFPELTLFDSEAFRPSVWRPSSQAPQRPESCRKAENC
jgi:hypothetical protein